MHFKALIAALCIILFGSASVLGQRDVPQNLPKFDKKKLHFGFQLGLSSNGFALRQDPSRTDSLVKLEYGTQPGFIIHVVSNGVRRKP